MTFLIQFYLILNGRRSGKLLSMRKKIIKVSMYIIGGILFLVLGLLVALWSISPGKADPITDSDGAPLAGSILLLRKLCWEASTSIYLFGVQIQLNLSCYSCMADQEVRRLSS